jgi:hypothetical protein
MNRFLLTALTLLTMTGCAGYYSHFQQRDQFNEEFTFDGEPRNFELADASPDEDVGSQEMISFDQ